jgi:hypothetical protein
MVFSVVQDTRIRTGCLLHIMSGFRSIHREKVSSSSSSSNEDTAIWCVQVTPLLQRSSATAANHLATAALPVWRIWTADSNGSVYSYTATEASHSNTTNSTTQDTSADSLTPLDTLTASALQLQCTHSLVGGRNNSSSSSAMLGCTQLCTIRNYIGEDDTAGDLVVLTLGLSGTCRVWVFTDDWDDHQAPSSSKPDAPPPRNVPCLEEFTVDNATGTTLAARVVAAWQTIVVAVGCLDGTIAIVDTGIPTVSAAAAAASTKDSNSEGTTVPINTRTAGTLLEYVVASEAVFPLIVYFASLVCGAFFSLTP